MDEFEVIKRARAMLQASRAAAVSERTKDGYKAKAVYLMKLAAELEGEEIERLIAVAKKTKSASTWFSRRAALAHSFRRAVDKLLTKQDAIQRTLRGNQVPVDSDEWDAWRAIVAKIGQLIEWQERLDREPGPSIADRRPRHSKRKDMHGLPEDWRERVIARMPSYRLAVLVQAVTGCRPDELTRGVRLKIVGGELVAEIQGSKVTAKAGQPWRRLSWSIDSDSPLVRMLVGEVLAGAAVAKIEDAKTYSGAVRAAGAREWPRRKASLAPYCFRHQMASDMKASGSGDSDISAALGHCVDVARSYYGQWQQGRSSGGVAPKRVEAARGVRIKKRQTVKRIGEMIRIDPE